MNWLLKNKNREKENKNINYKKANILAAAGIVLGVILIGLIVLVQKQSPIGNTFDIASQGFTKMFAAPEIPPAITPLPTEPGAPSASPSPSTPENQVSPEYPTQDPNPVISCTSSYPSCVDQSIRLPQNECSAITCCQIGNNWSIYPNQSKCSQAQNAASAQNSTDDTATNFVVPTPIPAIPLVSCQTTTGIYQLTQNQCNQAQLADQQLRAAYEQDYNNCVTAVQSNYQSTINTYNRTLQAFGGDESTVPQIDSSAGAYEAQGLTQCAEDYPNH